jgi:hypothetical protein
MNRRVVSAVLAVGLAVGGEARAQQPVLQVQGQPYFGGSMTLHVTAPSAIGQPVVLAVGLNPLPLDAPAYTSKGPFYIGNLLTVFALGAIGGNGRLDMPFVMPPVTPGTEGIPIALQAYVAPALSNPATVYLDEPYYLTANAFVIESPLPVQGANFGDQVTVGDFNGDGIADLGVGAWFEDSGQFDSSGRAFLFWGPDFIGFEVLSPPVPKQWGEFGAEVLTADVDGDSVDDLVVAENCGGDPPSGHGYLHVFKGNPGTAAPWLSIPSAGTGNNAVLFGRISATADLDGDSSPDFVVGSAYSEVNGLAEAGRIEVHWGPTYATVAVIDNPDPKVGDFFGSRVCLADVTGDGRPDVVAGSGRTNVGSFVDTGRLHVFDGPTLALLQTIENPMPATGDRFGEGLHAADLDGDGTAEVIAADVKKNIYVVWDPLAPSDVLTRSKPPSPNPGGDSSFGYFFAVTDANADGDVDIVIADPFEGDLPGCAFAEEGAVYVSLAPYFSTFYRRVSPFPACADQFSWGMVAGDIDGDGRDELICGTPTTDPGGISNVGRITVVRP